MGYNTKNHMKQGGEKLVIGGTLEIQDGATVIGLAAEHQANSTAEDVSTLVTDFNALLSKLITAGLMKDAEEE